MVEQREQGRRHQLGGCEQEPPVGAEERHLSSGGEQDRFAVVHLQVGAHPWGPWGCLEGQGRCQERTPPEAIRQAEGADWGRSQVDATCFGIG